MISEELCQTNFYLLWAKVVSYLWQFILIFQKTGPATCFPSPGKNAEYLRVT